MPDQAVVSREKWIVARKELLEKEKHLTRLHDGAKRTDGQAGPGATRDDSIEDLFSCERAESRWLDRRSRTPNNVFPWARFSTKSADFRRMTDTPVNSPSACEQSSRSSFP